MQRNAGTAELTYRVLALKVFWCSHTGQFKKKICKCRVGTIAYSPYIRKLIFKWVMAWKCVQWRLCGIRECKYIGRLSSEIATKNLRRSPPRFLWPNFPSLPWRTRLLCVDCVRCETPLILRKFAEDDVVYSSEIALYLMCMRGRAIQNYVSNA